jgi:Mn2+/Fe2+ NRAMP family transporter
VGEARGWPVGLARKPQQAKAFYGAIAVATLLGAAANVFGLNPVKALIWAAVLNGIVAVPVMALLMLLSTSTAIMGKFRISGRSTVIGWGATAVMGVASAAFLLAMLRPGQ